MRSESELSVNSTLMFKVKRGTLKSRSVEHTFGCGKEEIDLPSKNDQRATFPHRFTVKLINSTDDGDVSAPPPSGRLFLAALFF
jgi:hypothetical protein